MHEVGVASVPIVYCLRIYEDMGIPLKKEECRFYSALFVKMTKCGIIFS